MINLAHHRGGGWRRDVLALLPSMGVSLLSSLSTARADDITTQSASTVPSRPAIQFNRWEEDWSVLANPHVARQPLDPLKYIPFSSTDPYFYLSFGADVRERFESNDAPSFGTGANHAQNYDISRTEYHADLRLGQHVQIFTQLQSDFAPGKTMLVPVDQDRLDLEQSFITVSEPVAAGELKVRLGRQQFAFDLQRFVSVRDGPNVRQSYDAAWVDYEKDPWRVIAFSSRPVQVQDETAFDDYSSDKLTFSMFRIERQLTDTISFSSYYAHFTQADVKFPNASGNERREVLDAHIAGTLNHFDWDIEAMGQAGSIGSEGVLAWAFGSLAGYTFVNLQWTPRVGVQLDAASGDTNAQDHTLGTFNPLFPNGYYVTLAGYTGYTNLIHLKPSITLHPTTSLTLTLAAAGLWRESTADAIYTQPDIPVPNTAGQPDRYTGAYGQFRIDWAATTSSSYALEFDHYAIGDVIRRAGGHDSNYLGLEAKYGW